MTADVFAGDFTVQPLVFAHLWDVAGATYNADGVEVICNQDPATRLRHYFSEENVQKIEDCLGLQTTVVILFNTSGLDVGSDGTEFLRYVGSFATLRQAPGQT